MQAMIQSISAVESTYRESTTIKATIYKLNEMISKERHLGEDQLVSSIVLHLHDIGWIKFIGNLRGFNILNAFSVILRQSRRTGILNVGNSVASRMLHSEI